MPAIVGSLAGTTRIADRPGSKVVARAARQDGHANWKAAGAERLLPFTFGVREPGLALHAEEEPCTILGKCCAFAGEVSPPPARSITR